MCKVRDFLSKWFKITPTKSEIHSDLERIEGHYKDIKSDLEKIQQSIDPITRLLMDMEILFKDKKNVEK